MGFGYKNEFLNFPILKTVPREELSDVGDVYFGREYMSG